jgi:hypothetical protein
VWGNTRENGRSGLPSGEITSRRVNNFPVDAGACSYSVLWNAFKRITRNATSSEKEALYRGTAARVYHLDLNWGLNT